MISLNSDRAIIRVIYGYKIWKFLIPLASSNVPILLHIIINKRIPISSRISSGLVMSALNLDKFLIIHASDGQNKVITNPRQGLEKLVASRSEIEGYIHGTINSSGQIRAICAYIISITDALALIANSIIATIIQIIALEVLRRNTSGSIEIIARDCVVIFYVIFDQTDGHINLVFRPKMPRSSRYHI